VYWIGEAIMHYSPPKAWFYLKQQKRRRSGPSLPASVVLLFDGASLLAGQTPVDQVFGAPALVLGSTAVVIDGGIRVAGTTGDVRFPVRPGFQFPGQFSVKIRYTKFNWGRAAGPDFLVSLSQTTSNQRGWILQVGLDNILAGRFGNGAGGTGDLVDTVSSGTQTVPIPAGKHEILYDRGADMYCRAYLDGVMVAKTAAPVLGTNLIGAPYVRVTGSTTGNTDPGPSVLHYLEVRKGEALCGLDAGYTP
jgi:hypothetical protein